MENGLRELANANDSIDRLRQVQLSLEEDERRRERINDLVIRGILLAVIGAVLVVAVYNL